MAASQQESASFLTQADALLRKNLAYQRRRMRTNIKLVAFPVVICVLWVYLPKWFGSLAGLPQGEVSSDSSDRCSNVSSFMESVSKRCPIQRPPVWPALLQLPPPPRGGLLQEMPFGPPRRGSLQQMPLGPCEGKGPCHATILLTGDNRTLGEGLGSNLLTTDFPTNSSVDSLLTLANLPLGTNIAPETGYLLEPSFQPDGTSLYLLQPQCTQYSNFSVTIRIDSESVQKEVHCLQTLQLWRSSSSIIIDELLNISKHPEKENSEKVIAAFDFLNTDMNNFNVKIWIDASKYSDHLRPSMDSPAVFMRITRLLNLASNAYLQLMRGAGVKALLDFVKEMPTFESEPSSGSADPVQMAAEFIHTLVIMQLFPVIVVNLVYEKQQNLRSMMKMHGLGDGPYWVISYAFFLSFSFAYVFAFVAFGSFLGMEFFRMTSYSIQFVFYFVYINLQIALAFLFATFLSTVKTAASIAQLFVTMSALLGLFIFRKSLEDMSISGGSIIVMELFPGFSLYRGVYEFSQFYALQAENGFRKMQWEDLNDSLNGIREVLIIMSLEWFLVITLGYYLDQVIPAGSGVKKHPLFFLKSSVKKPSPSNYRQNLQSLVSNVSVEMEKPDVSQEREKVEQLLHDHSTSHILVSDNIRKVFPGKDGNPDKIAVKGLSLAVPRGECFGLLGPNGAGKTSWFSMMIGLTPPTSGTAFIDGLNICTDMDKIHSSMGVCPQHDLLWETLTAREHLFFYGRLRNLKGSALAEAVEEALKNVNLDAVGDKQAGQFSGGMKRRLSVAISIIGDPKVVYMDEPSTGLDPASRRLLWDIVKRVKHNKAIVLTTHSMEEADALCDRLGIFVDGSLQCVGNSKELKGRYGGYYLLTMTTSSNVEKEVESLVHGLSPNAKKVYHISGTQKFELPKEEVRVADVFDAVEKAKSSFTIHAWAMVDTTLEDVFIKVARDAQQFKMFS